MATSSPDATATPTPDGALTATPTPSATPGGARVNHLVIRQVFAGGGSSISSTLLHKDAVELFNPSAGDLSLAGLSLQYGSSTGNLGASALGILVLPDHTLPPGGAYLISLGAWGTGGAELSVTADISSALISMSASNGKLALAAITSTLGCGAAATPCALPSAQIIDLVGYGTANLAEGEHAVPALSNTKVALRKQGGCVDSEDNAADFDVVGEFVPRNAASPPQLCP
jgi:uncharacterized protein